MGVEKSVKPPEWREIVRRLVPRARFARGANHRALASAESVLSLTFPSELRGLLSATNGVTAEDGTRLVWSVAELVSQNRVFRELARRDANLYAPFEGLLLFGEEGNGDVFAYQLEAGAPAVQTIVQWDHENDDRMAFARDLEDYLRLRGDAASAHRGSSTPSSGEDTPQVVSVWVWSHRSQERISEYLAAGGSGRVSKDGLPASRFQADYCLGMAEVLRTEQHAVFEPRPTELRRLLDGIHGSEPLAAAIAHGAAASGGVRAHGAILVYGLRYELRAAREPRHVRYIGCFEFD